jgi:hypothetical protein
VLLQVPANDVIDDCATVSEDLEIDLLFVLDFSLIDWTFEVVLLAIRSF